MNIVNLMGRVVVVRDENGETTAAFRPDGGVLSAQKITEKVGEIEILPGTTVDLMAKTYVQVPKLPDPEPGTYFLVPVDAALAVKARGRTTSDLLVVPSRSLDPDGSFSCRRFLIV